MDMMDYNRTHHAGNLGCPRASPPCTDRHYSCYNSMLLPGVHCDWARTQSCRSNPNDYPNTHDISNPNPQPDSAGLNRHAHHNPHSYPHGLTVRDADSESNANHLVYAEQYIHLYAFPYSLTYVYFVPHFYPFVYGRTSEYFYSFDHILPLSNALTWQIYFPS